MTEFGLFIASRSVSKARLARRTGLSPTRIRDLSFKDSARPMGFELYLVALAIEVEPAELLRKLYGELKINKDA